MRPYPLGKEAQWLAADTRGQLGLFGTFGIGPIPTPVLAMQAEDVEDRVMRLPKIGDAKLLVQVPDPFWFVEPAERGFFVFDWSGPYGGNPRDYRDRYVAAAVPGRPIAAAVLPPEFDLEGAPVPLPITDFATNPRVDVRALVDCIDGYWV